MNKDEILFEVCDILKINSINYWICHGTLLGIVRENRILPWDNDIDIGVWAHEVSKNDIIMDDCRTPEIRGAKFLSNHERSR